MEGFIPSQLISWLPPSHPHTPIQPSSKFPLHFTFSLLHLKVAKVQYSLVVAEVRKYSLKCWISYSFLLDVSGLFVAEQKEGFTSRCIIAYVYTHTSS